MDIADRHASTAPAQHARIHKPPRFERILQLVAYASHSQHPLRHVGTQNTHQSFNSCALARPYPDMHLSFMLLPQTPFKHIRKLFEFALGNDVRLDEAAV